MKNYLFCIACFSKKKGFSIANAEVTAGEMTLELIADIRERLADELGVRSAREVVILNIMEVK